MVGEKTGECGEQGEDDEDEGERAVSGTFRHLHLHALRNRLEATFKREVCRSATVAGESGVCANIGIPGSLLVDCRQEICRDRYRYRQLRYETTAWSILGGGVDTNSIRNARGSKFSAAGQEIMSERGGVKRVSEGVADCELGF